MPRRTSVVGRERAERVRVAPEHHRADAIVRPARDEVVDDRLRGDRSGSARCPPPASRATGRASSTMSMPSTSLESRAWMLCGPMSASAHQNEGDGRAVPGEPARSQSARARRERRASLPAGDAQPRSMRRLSQPTVATEAPRRHAEREQRRPRPLEPEAPRLERHLVHRLDDVGRRGAQRERPSGGTDAGSGPFRRQLFGPAACRARRRAAARSGAARSLARSQGSQCASSWTTEHPRVLEHVAWLRRSLGLHLGELHQIAAPPRSCRPRCSVDIEPGERARRSALEHLVGRALEPVEAERAPPSTRGARR